MSALGWAVSLAVIAWAGWWLIGYIRREFTIVGFIGPPDHRGHAGGPRPDVLRHSPLGQRLGYLGTTLFYVFVGCSVQFRHRTGLAFLCSQPIRGKGFFRVIFFIPLMITPLGCGYAFRMLADTNKGPFQPFWHWIGLGETAWAANAWSARAAIIIGDSWQWIPFIFVVMLAALENVPRDQVEAANVDGASSWQIFREITWPQVIPVAATVMLIRVIEAFKIVDLTNIMTSGGPGIATESMTLQAYYTWRSNDFGSSAAVAYLLLFVTVVLCASFFNFIVLKQLRRGMNAPAKLDDAKLGLWDRLFEPPAIGKTGAAHQGHRLFTSWLLDVVRVVSDLLGGHHLIQAARACQPRAGIPAVHRLQPEPSRLENALRYRLRRHAALLHQFTGNWQRRYASLHDDRLDGGLRPGTHSVQAKAWIDPDFRCLADCHDAGHRHHGPAVVFQRGFRTCSLRFARPCAWQAFHCDAWQW